jgi:adenylate cyclase
MPLTAILWRLLARLSPGLFYPGRVTENAAVMRGFNETRHTPSDTKLMPIEIERKFLLLNDGWKRWVTRQIHIRDGLIASSNGNKARVRIADADATIALKGRRRGPIRTEFEYAIPYPDALEMLQTMCDGHVLNKVRHVIPYAGSLWHVDVYEGILRGVVLAEVELQHADQELNLPTWIGKEVTNDPRYRKVNMRRQRMDQSGPSSSSWKSPRDA